METCKMIKNPFKTGGDNKAKLIPVLPNGQHIPAIVRDTITVIDDEHQLRKGGYVKVQLQIFVKITDFEEL